MGVGVVVSVVGGSGSVEDDIVVGDALVGAGVSVGDDVVAVEEEVVVVVDGEDDEVVEEEEEEDEDDDERADISCKRV